MPTGSKQPLWVVTLVGKGGVAVGEVQVGANTGVILRKAWPQFSAQAETPASKRKRSTNRPKGGIGGIGGTGRSGAIADVATIASQPKPRQLQQPASVRPVVASITRRPQSGPRPTSLNGNVTARNEAPGQILENARQGIIRTTGSVRAFLKQALQDRE